MTIRLRTLWQQFVEDESGVVWTMELIMAATVVALGSLVGLATFRDALVQEFGDLAAASASLDQSYRYSSVSEDDTIGTVKFDYTIAGSGYSDQADSGQPNPVDPADAAPMCITFGGTDDEGN